jgi:hypothetical protein
MLSEEISGVKIIFTVRCTSVLCIARQYEGDTHKFRTLGLGGI